MVHNKSPIDSLITSIEDARIFRVLSSSFSSWAKHWPLVLLSVLVDFVFLLSLGAVITLIQFVLFEHLDAIMKLTGDATGGLVNIYNQTEQVGTGLMGLSNNPEFQTHLTIIFKYLGLMILATFLLWVIFQGISWYLAHRISNDKRQPFLVFWKNFAIASIPFFFLTVLWIFISVRLLVSIKMSIAPIMSEAVLNFLFALFVIVTWYFGALCYTLDNRYSYQNIKQCFLFGIKKFFSIIQSIAALAVLFIIIHFILSISIIKSDPMVIVVTGTILFMPALVFARVLLFRTKEEYWPEKQEKHE